MKPGRALDALVAEKIFGWVWIRSLAHYPPPRGREWQRELCPGDKVPKPSEAGDWLPAHGDEPANETTQIWEGSIPRYSTDIAAAWQVLEHLKTLGDYPEEVLMLSWNPRSDWWVHSERYPRSIEVNAETAPLAICLAALAAVGVETEAAHALG